MLNISFILAAEYDDSMYKKIQTELIMAKDGETIYLPKGKHKIIRRLWGENLSNVTLVGQGIDETILSFESQIEGAEGIKIINSKNITLKDFTIEDSKGDLIKVEDSKNINFINLNYYPHFEYPHSWQFKQPSSKIKFDPWHSGQGIPILGCSGIVFLFSEL